MTIQVLFIFANKEQSKGQKKINARPQSGAGGSRVLSLDVELRGFTSRRHEPSICAVQSSLAPVCETSHVPTFCSQPSDNFGQPKLEQ